MIFWSKVKHHFLIEFPTASMEHATGVVVVATAVRSHSQIHCGVLDVFEYVSASGIGIDEAESRPNQKSTTKTPTNIASLQVAQNIKHQCL